MNFTQFKKEKVFQRGRGGSDPQHLEDERLFHALLERYDEIERSTKKIEGGIEAITRVTSKDAELVKILQEHAVGMKKRFDGGRAIRSWDPMFTRLFDERDQIKMRWEMLEDGIKVTLKGEEAEIQELIDLHDETLHAFVDHGFRAAKEESPYRPQ
ncbi:hypothetical protein [Sulfurovum mangrovi]|uniref:hypothetical protein n=1 Tax=Sulfurovum mangrovi TaxID=2893889 RepID=UPI001E2E56E6|nr:hypothetical protein [Sulfurovum mangrovi]UFH58143.1 hypothetical protein LN246_07240 [Sulfurovum mangrovi]